jgi:SAM-dependent methyltransferase
LAIPAALRHQVTKLLDENQQREVDPVVNYLVLATNGIAYESMLGKLEHYPIPFLSLKAQPGAHFLDIGCSWGRWCVSAARLGYHAYGIDPSLGAVLAAKRVFKQFGLCGQFACGDGRAIPFPNNSFDVVHCYSVLQHFSDADADATWSEIGRVLRPGGIALVQMANAIGVRSLYHLVRRGFRRAAEFDVRYRLPTRLMAFGERHVGPTELIVDCFGGLGLQTADRELYRWPARCALSCSEFLKSMVRILPPMKILADSLFVKSIKRHRLDDDVDATQVTRFPA